MYFRTAVNIYCFRSEGKPKMTRDRIKKERGRVGPQCADRRNEESGL